MKRAMEDQAGGPGLGGLRVRVLELAEDLRLADDHRIETRANAKQVAYGSAGFMPVKRAGESCGIDAAIARQEAGCLGLGEVARRGHAHYLDAVAGGD